MPTEYSELNGKLYELIFVYFEYSAGKKKG